MSEFLSGKYDGLLPYVPGEQPQDKQYIKLNTNESPFAPSKLCMEKDFEKLFASLRLYPDPESNRLLDALAQRYSIDKKKVFVANGSDELLAFIFMAFGDSKKGFAFPDVTYGFYSVYQKLFGLPERIIPLLSDLTVCVDDYCNLDCNIMLANPNAQTGNVISVEQIERIVKSNSDNVVVIDEAYIDFGGESALPLIDKYDNLVVVRTMSKSRNLAGIRVGYCFASPKLIEDIKLMKYSFNSYNVNRLSSDIATAAILDNDYFCQCVEQIIEIREYTVKQLMALGFTLTQSKANFVLAKPPKMTAQELYLKLKQNGILVRYFAQSRISDYIRITIGSYEQMQTLIATLSAILEE